MRVDLTSEQAVRLAQEQGFIVDKPVRVSKTNKCITVNVRGDGPSPLPLRITRKEDGSYRTTLHDVSVSIDPKIAKRALRAKKLRTQKTTRVKRP
jgi:hypothetical protein